MTADDRPRRAQWLGPARPWVVRGLNAARHRFHRAAMIVEAIAAGRVGRCSCCGTVGPMLLDRRVVGPELVRRWGLSPRLADALTRKESLACFHCDAKSRVRALADVILRIHPCPCPSIRSWARTPQAKALRIAEINRVEGLHDALAGLQNLRASDFRDPAAPGAFDASVPHEDLCHLTYEDASFDLVITSETLEHVPDLDVALAEIHRVLAPGGHHVFTIPLLPGVEKTYPRARLDEDGNLVPLVEPRIAHPGGDWGYPVFTEFGADLPAILDRAGFDVTLHFGPPTEDNLTQVWVATRRPD